MEMKNIKKIKYQIYCKEDFRDRELALSLFDLFNFYENIVLFVFRAYSNFDNTLRLFSEKVPCKIIKDVTRNDSYCIFIPKIISNKQLFELITSNDIQTEWTYIPFVNDFENILYNRENLKRKSSVECNFSIFEGFFDAESGLIFQFDVNHIETEKIEANIEKWEKTFKEDKFKKIIK